MDARFTVLYAREINNLRNQEIELFVNLAKVVAMQRTSRAAEEIR